MTSINIFKYSINKSWAKYLLIVFSLVFYVLSIIISDSQTGDIGNNFRHAKVQKYIYKIENIMMDIDKNYIQNIIDSSSSSLSELYFSKKLIEYANDNDIHAFVISNDEIKAWTDNDFVINTPIRKNETYFYKCNIGDFIVKDISHESFTLRLVSRLYSYYSVNNEYLQSGINNRIGIDKQPEFRIADNEKLQIVSIDGEYLFNTIWSNNSNISVSIYTYIFVFYILSLLFILSFSQQMLEVVLQNKFLVLLAQIVSIIALISIWIKVLLPTVLVDSMIFSSSIFASYLFDSIGMLFIKLLGVLFIIFSLSKFYIKLNPKENKYKWNVLIYLLFIVLFIILLHLVKAVVSDLIFNSTISFNLARISDISYLAILGLISIGISIISFIFVFLETNILVREIKKTHQLIALLFFLIIEFSIILFTNSSDFSIIIFFITISIINFLLLNDKNDIGRATSITILLLAFSLLVAYWVNILNIENERVNRKSIIQNLAINQDPQAEFLFTKLSKKIYSDDILLNKFNDSSVDFDSITSYIENKYFKNQQHFKKYDFQTTICTHDLVLIIRPENIEINCDSFFFHNLIGFGKLTNNKNLYRLEYGTGQINYLGVFRFYGINENGSQVFTVYMEINSKLKRKGFTRLLMAKEYDPFAKINNYSLARYENNRRVEKYGNYAYPEHLPDAFKIEKEIDFSENNDYSHLIYRLSNGYVYVLSLKNQPIFGRLAPFSYLFILFGVLYALMYLFSGNNVLFNTKLKLNFGKRLQLIMIAIILSSFTIISMLTVLYINDLNENKNKDQLTRLAVSLQTEFEHKLSSQKDLSKIDPSYLNSLLQKFSKVFDTDINIYLLDGTLLSSTRPEIFNKNLMSELINPQALFDLKYEHQSIFIARENIGMLVFSSAYMPFHNSDGEIIALLNLPYFAKEEILKSEVSTLLMALMNVYTLIIVVAILLILFVSKYISRPLLMLKLHMQGVKMGKDNNKIEWSGIEEIQALVSEYNKMIDALEISSEKLAKSERETAWREMAKQVAHEIKNPLTPMKLSVQYMMHSYDENGKNQKEKLQSLSNTLVEQIDALTDIATAFSDFANMPKSTKEMYNMASIINATADIYKDYDNVQINLDLDSDIIIRIDKNQWLRVYNNLFKNSIQAIIPEQQMLIDVSLNRVGDDVVVIFKDNGQGISEEMKDKIFVPSFTTKTTGSGLGLAMVRNIVNNSDGEISFESELGKGTSFIIKLKV